MLQHIGKYEIVEQIGRGGQGTVYRARDTGLDRIVAIKVIDQSIADDPGYLDALRREAQLAASLDHPNIVTVHALEVENDTAYIVMEYIPDSLDRQIRSGRLEPRRAVSITEQVCRALAHAHDLGVVHRDIKPANILLTATGEAKLSDFGIARAIASSTRAPRTSAAGTYAYLPPEQWEERPAVDRRSDIYSVGVTLFEMLAGVIPFAGNSVIEIHRQHQEDPVPPLPRNIRAPSGLGDLIQKAMAKRPELRFQTAGDMADGLGGLFGASEGSNKTPSASAPTLPEVPPRRPVESEPGRGRIGGIPNWLLVGGLGAAVIAVIAVVAVLAGRINVDDDGKAQVDQVAPEAANDSIDEINHVNPGIQVRIIFDRSLPDSADHERGTSKIYTLNPESGVEQLIFEYGQWTGDFAFSETNNHLAFRTYQCAIDLPPPCSDAQDGIRILDMDVRKPQGMTYEDLSVLVDGKNPSWSPDGNNIAFASDRDGDWNIYTMTKEGAEQTQITYSSLDDLAPAWSPNGEWVAFVQPENGIWLVNLGGVNLVQITLGDDRNPIWSPDGKHMVFERLDTVGLDLYIISLSIDGSWMDNLAITRLTQHQAADGSASWSPDSNNIAFVSYRDDDAEIYTMRKDGAKQLRLTTNETDDYAPSWSPSGDKIAFLSLVDNWYSDIFIMDDDGVNQTRLTATDNIMESDLIWAGRQGR